MRYIHFTDEQDAKKIKEEGVLLASSIIDAVFAVAEGGPSVPEVQKTRLGRPKNRNVAVVFETVDLPDTAYPEEVLWHMPRLKIHNVQVMSAEEASSLLDGSLPRTMDDTLDIPVHPSFVDKRTLDRIRINKESVLRFIMAGHTNRHTSR